MFGCRVVTTPMLSGHDDYFLQDIPENGADVAHLNYLHEAGISSGSEVNYKDLLWGKIHTHEWVGKWEGLGPPNNHVGRMTLSMTNKLLGIRIKSLDFKVTADQVSGVIMTSNLGDNECLCRLVLVWCT